MPFNQILIDIYQLYLVHNVKVLILIFLKIYVATERLMCRTASTKFSTTPYNLKI